MIKMPKSIRKFIRREKSRIRREILGFKKQEEKIEELCQRFFKKPEKLPEKIKAQKKLKNTLL